MFYCFLYPIIKEILDLHINVQDENQAISFLMAVCKSASLSKYKLQFHESADIY